MKGFSDKFLSYVFSAILFLAVSVLTTPTFAFVGPSPISNVVQTIGCDVGVSNGSSKPVVVCTNPRFHGDDNWD